MRKLLTALLTLLLALLLCACGSGTQGEDPTEVPTDPTDPPAAEYTINFELNGGEGDEGFVPSIKVPNCETAKIPIPKKEGYVFVGW